MPAPRPRRGATVFLLGAWSLALGAGGCAPGAIEVATLPPDPLAAGLVAHWPFDDGVGSKVVDRSGNKRDGALVGGTWIEGRFGGALRFALGDEVAVPAFPNATPSWTVSLWVRRPSDDVGDAFHTIISTEIVFVGGWEMNVKLTPTGSLYEFAYWIGPGDSDYGYSPCPCVAPNQWTHLAAVLDAPGATLSFYLNGAMAAHMPMPRPILAGNPVLFMGRWQRDATRPFVGDLDDVAIYDRALLPSDIARLATSAAPIPSMP